MSDWTPGPWKVVAVSMNSTPRFWIVDEQGAAIARLPKKENSEANARLIAASRKMAELIRYIAEELEEEYSDAWAIKRAQMLLAEIEGKDGHTEGQG